MAKNNIRRPPRGGRGLKFPDHGRGRSPAHRRPPRGGRGLKSLLVLDILVEIDVAPLAGGVD